MDYCKICGEPNCKKHSFLVSNARIIEKIEGSSPPEIFVGRWNYPNVYAGILSPSEYGDNYCLSSPEYWHERKMPISAILKLRNKLVYGRIQTNIKKAVIDKKFLPVMQEIAMAKNSVANEMNLKKPIKRNEENDTKHIPLIAKAAEISNARLQENPKIENKIDYLVNDTDAKAAISLAELQKSGIETSRLIKLLSAGLLGLKKNRKLVPTRWAITAVDDTLSKEKIKKIKNYPTINEIRVFNAEYVGNHYEFILLPETYSFEVIEISLNNLGIWHDFESNFPRKTYASSVTGAYYANRLALTEYLEKIKKQATCIVLREIKPEYNSPLGVGILRQISREAFSQNPLIFEKVEDALKNIQTRIKTNINNYIRESILIKNKKEQKKITSFF